MFYFDEKKGKHMRFYPANKPESQQQPPITIPVSQETELILRALQEGKVARPKPMPPVRRPLR
jgi:hypothetical protein